MSLKHGLLGLLSLGGPTTGYDLDKHFKNSLAHFWQAKTSQIYRELSAMEDARWLTSKRILQEEKPNKRVYSITSGGKEELLNWIALQEADLGRSVKSTFLMRLFFCGESGEIGKEQALKLVHRYRDICSSHACGIKQIQEMLETELSEYPQHTTYWKLTALHGEITYKAGIEWADKAIEILERTGYKM